MTFYQHIAPVNNTRIRLVLFNIFFTCIAVLSGCNQESLGIQKGDASAFLEEVIINELNINGAVVSASNPIIAVGDSQQFTANGTTDTGAVDITSDVRWSVSDVTIASINDDGLLTGLAEGDVSITAEIASLSASGNIRVTAAALTAIDITSDNTDPADLATTACKEQQFTATARYSGETEVQDITQLVTWTAEASAGGALSDTIAQFSTNSDENGLLLTTTADSGIIIKAQRGTDPLLGAGTVAIIDGSAVVTVTPATTTININSTTAFTASATYGDGSITDVTRTAFWESTNATVATISNTLGSKGVATAKGIGSTDITAACNAQQSVAANMSVEEIATLSSINIGYDIDDLATSGSSSEAIIYITTENELQLTATTIYSDGSTASITTNADTEWSVINSSNADPVPATINNTNNKGLLTINGNGTVNVTLKYTPSGVDAEEDNITIVVTRP